MNMVIIICKIIISYILGSISGSMLVGRLKGIDIRKMGSGNAGGTNTFRIMGTFYAFIVLLIDGMKSEALIDISEVKSVYGTREIKENEVIIDVGANIGYYSIMLANIVGSNGKIYALEPEPTNYQTLKKNITLNKLENIIEPYQMGASDTNSPRFLYRSKYSNMHSFILPENDILDIKNPKSQIEIKMTNLSDFISNKEPIDMLRMDIEGYEVEVLLGLQDAIKNNTWTGKILFECHFKKYNETHNIKNKLEFLFDNGYKTRYVTSTDERKPRIRNLGYKPIKIIQTNDTRFRGIYENISNPDTIQLICNSGGVRDVLFEKIVT